MLVIFPHKILYAEISAWYTKLKYNKVEIRIFLHRTVLQQPRKFLFVKQSITWKQAIRCFIEHGTVARLGERTEYCMLAL